MSDKLFDYKWFYIILLIIGWGSVIMLYSAEMQNSQNKKLSLLRIKKTNRYTIFYAPLAQLDRAADF